MVKELEKMREIRTNQRSIRISLKKREEQNKLLRSKITAIWNDPCKVYDLYLLAKELAKGRKKTTKYHKLLREFKVNLRETNRSYDLAKK